MSYPWIIDFDSPGDPRKGIQIKHIRSGNDGDVCNSCVTYEILKGTDTKYCVDIGVDEGWWSLFAANSNLNCKIDAFEPNEISFSALKPYIDSQKQITLHNLAVSDSFGILPFTVKGGESNSRIDSETYVACDRIDRFIKDKTVNLIKIDTEGHDIIILKTLHPYLKQIEAIIFECTVYWYGKSKEECIQTTLDELLYLKLQYAYMYILSRRGNPILTSLHTEASIKDFINLSYTNSYQVDILVCNKPIILRSNS